jgi:polyribonucleotide nucleotidyltransferase
VHNFGVFVEILPGYEGLIHVSELDIKKVASPEKAGIVSGQKLDVKFLGKNEKGQMRLSRRVVLLRDAGKEDPSVSPPAAVSSASAEAAY